jgi:hypothetical protein
MLYQFTTKIKLITLATTKSTGVYQEMNVSLTNLNVFRDLEENGWIILNG